MKLAAFFEIVGNGFCYAVAGYGGSGVQLVGRTGFDVVVTDELMARPIIGFTCLIYLLIVSPKASFIKCQRALNFGCIIECNNVTCITSIIGRYTRTN